MTKQFTLTISVGGSVSEPRLDSHLESILEDLRSYADGLNYNDVYGYVCETGKMDDPKPVTVNVEILPYVRD